MHFLKQDVTGGGAEHADPLSPGKEEEEYTVLRKAPEDNLISLSKLLEDIVVTPDLNIPQTIVESSDSMLGYTLKPIPADKEDLKKLDGAPVKKKVGRPLKLASALPKARPAVGRPPGPAVVATDEVQFVATLPRVAKTPLRIATRPASLASSPGPLLGPNMGHISVTKKREPAVVDANKARFLALKGLSLTGPSPTNKQNSSNLNNNKQLSSNKQKPMIQPNHSRGLPIPPQATRKGSQQRLSPYPQQQQQRMQQTRGIPYNPQPRTIGTPADILRALSAPAVQQSPARMPPHNRGMPPHSRGAPPPARAMPPYSRGVPPQARGVHSQPPQRNMVRRGQKIMSTGPDRRNLTPKAGPNQPRAWIDTPRPITNQPRAWANQKQSAISNTLRALNQNQGMSVSNQANLTRPLSRQPSGIPMGAKQNVPLGVTIAAPKS